MQTEYGPTLRMVGPLFACFSPVMETDRKTRHGPKTQGNTGECKRITRAAGMAWCNEEDIESACHNVWITQDQADAMMENGELWLETPFGSISIEPPEQWEDDTAYRD